MLIVFDEKNPHSAVIAGWGLWVTYFMNAIQIVWYGHQLCLHLQRTEHHNLYKPLRDV